MRLQSLNYDEFKGQPYQWAISGLALSGVNLIVGQNASGKTRALNVVANLALRVCAERKELPHEACYRAEFAENNQQIVYTVAIHNGQVTEESFVRSGKTLLNRSAGGNGTIFYEQVGRELEFSIPATELAASRRDSRQHSFLVPLQDWGHHTFNFYFGTSLGKESLLLSATAKGPVACNLRDPDTVVGIFVQGRSRFGNDFVNALIRDMDKIGYDLERITVGPIKGVVPRLPGGPVGLIVKERALGGETNQLVMSQGMFRALSLLTLLNYSVFAAGPKCLIVDDIGEGLDFARSFALVQLLMSKARERDVQLIMATNDRFIMNAVPLECWTVLRRVGQEIRVSNYQNSPRAFEEFKFTGLSNFDLLATSFLDEQTSQEG
jgi:energy-coupling factor transporter ATP-binding protein EcfA2